jgi:hypothetical protein
MSAYAIAHVQSVTPGPEIAEYLLRIDATLAPFQGRFLVHGRAAHTDQISIALTDQTLPSITRVRRRPNRGLSAFRHPYAYAAHASLGNAPRAHFE